MTVFAHLTTEEPASVHDFNTSLIRSENTETGTSEQRGYITAYQSLNFICYPAIK